MTFQDITLRIFFIFFEESYTNLYMGVERKNIEHSLKQLLGRKRSEGEARATFSVVFSRIIYKYLYMMRLGVWGFWAGGFCGAVVEAVRSTILVLKWSF
jgi:hypothetical protein